MKYYETELKRYLTPLTVNLCFTKQAVPV